MVLICCSNKLCSHAFWQLHPQELAWKHFEVCLGWLKGNFASWWRGRGVMWEINKFDSWVGNSYCGKGSGMMRSFVYFWSLSQHHACVNRNLNFKLKPIGIYFLNLDITNRKYKTSGWHVFEVTKIQAWAFFAVLWVAQLLNYFFVNVSCRWLLGWRKRNWLKSTPHLAPFQTSADSLAGTQNKAAALYICILC
jgi:hypothetical protein